MSTPEVFIDGLLNVTLVKGLVRLDFFSMSATETQKDGQPVPELRQRLIVNPQSLLEVYQSLQVAIMALNEKGVVNMRPLGNDPAPPTLAPQPQALPTGSAHAAALQADGGGTTEPRGPAGEVLPRPLPRSRNFPSTLGN